MTEDAKSAIVALNQKQEEGGVNKNNPYVFAVNDTRSGNALRGHDVLHNSYSKVTLEKPELDEFEKVCGHREPARRHE